MSNSDGSYEIKKMPWTEVNAQGVVMLRTDDFSFDLFSFNYEGRVLAARYSGAFSRTFRRNMRVTLTPI